MKLIETDKPVCKLCLSNTVFTNITMTAAIIKSENIFHTVCTVAINVSTRIMHSVV